jgi:hypothetical protein
MSLQNWLQNSWLVQHAPTPEEIINLLAISDRDLAACQVKELPSDWRFAIAYSVRARFQACRSGCRQGFSAPSRRHFHSGQSRHDPGIIPARLKPCPDTNRLA